jgi:mono/diheme cytochrome c family protein
VKSRLIRPILGVAALACLGSLAVVSAQGNPEAAKITNPVASSPESISLGQQRYARYCAACHGRTGDGGAGNDLIPAAPSLVDATWDHGSSDGEIFDAIKNGIQPDLNMVPFKDRLKDEEIWAVINFLKSIKKP